MTRSPAPAALGARIDAAVLDERRRALRALLASPLLAADGPQAAEFGLVRRHAGWLREWFARHPGWSLRVDSEAARLRKTPADLGDATRPARARRGDPPFPRRRYALACLALAVLERTERQTALGKLADEIMALVAGDADLAAAGYRFDLTGRDQRRDLVAVVRLLLDLRVLVRVTGDEEAYLAERGDVLYTINRPALAGLLAVRRGPSTVEAGTFEERLAAIVAEPLPDTDAGRNRARRTHLVRRLLDDPVVYYDDLDADTLDYLHRQRGRLLTEIADATGLVPEVRAEGIALVDERGDATDLGLPEEGTDGHLTLLLAEHLAAHARRHPDTPVAPAALHRHTARLIARHKAHWRKAVTEPGADVALAEATLDRLEALALVRRTPDGVVPRAAIARYALQSPPEEQLL
ncbi:MAG TPA: TIGR02678 family protein [Egibacteraceae bacterium]|nr:TIGR02678 family protein [Egibacteraceae bacterium]